MKDIDLSTQIADAAEMAHRAYFAQCVGSDALSASESHNPPVDVMRVSSEWLRNAPLSPNRAHLLMTFAEIDMRHYFARELAVKTYAAIRENKFRRQASLHEIFACQCGAQTRASLCQTLADCDLRLTLINVIQEWKSWDPTQTGGWVFENIEKAIAEVESLWSTIRVIALRLKSSGRLEEGTVRELCAGILGGGLKGDRELEVISNFYYENAFHGYRVTTSINEGVPYVKYHSFGEQGKQRRDASFSDIKDHLCKRMRYLVNGLDAGVSAARLLMLLHTGNYVAAGERLCRVSLPIEPTEGNFEDLSRPDLIHPMPRDYAWCARRAIQFASAGFVWPTMVAANHDPSLINQMIDKLWIPKVFNTFYVIADGKNVPRDDAMAFATAVYARLMALSGWFNPVLMRQHLEELFLETVEILTRFRETVADLEEVIDGGLISKPEDIIAFSGGVVDAGLNDDERYAILIRYQRESAACALATAARSQEEVSP